MADTPILNYKGKYDGPEIDKAVELALGLENPESCPYYVHVSLSQPEYVLTIGLGDSEGNIFNHAEIDLPLESMVVNATYENGNIILHLQDGTSTEPIPISALIAGLVSETRTIAGIDLTDDITPKELRDALSVYTKDSVDQLVSELENTINETLNEMEQSLDELSELTSEHDTQIEKNTSDIAINNSTIGTRSKNCLEITATSKTAEDTGGLTITVNDDKSITINGTAPASGYRFTVGIFAVREIKKYLLSGCPSGGGNTKYQLYSENNDFAVYNAGGESGFTPKIKGRQYFTIIIYGNVECNNLIFYPMIRYADIIDATYEPYKPSVNERLVDVEESVSELTPQVEQNKSDISLVKNDIAVNRATLGTQKKNLIDQSLLLNASGWTVDENEVYSGMLDTMYAKFSNEYPTDILFKEKTSYTFSCQFKANTAEGNLQALLVNVEYTDGTTSTIITTKESSDFIKYTGVTDKNKTIKTIKMSYMKNRTCYIKNMQLEEGTVATEYEPYKPSLQEQINALVAEIAELKANQTTVSE